MGDSMKNIMMRITGADPLLVEMAEVYRMPLMARIKYIYLPALLGNRKGGR